MMYRVDALNLCRFCYSPKRILAITAPIIMEARYQHATQKIK